MLGAAWLARLGGAASRSPAVPIALYGAAIAGKPFVPINYRLADEQVRAIVARTAPATIVVGRRRRAARSGRRRRAHLPRRAAGHVRGRVVGGRRRVRRRRRRTRGAAVHERDHRTSRRRPSCATAPGVLRPATVEFAGAAGRSAALVSVPPYHVAGISATPSAPTPAGVSCSSRRSSPRMGGDGRARGPSPTRWSCRPCSAASSTCVERATATRCRRCATWPTAVAGCPYR